MTTSAPSDSTGAIGTTRYMEMVNTDFAIYNRTSNSPLVRGTLNELGGVSPFDNVFDPQVIWDPGTNRFYYTMDDIRSSANNLLLIGFSKTSTPASAADFCQYEIDFGSEFPDYPKLGDDQNFWTIGANVFSGVTGAFIENDVYAITKPPSGSTCPAPTSFGFNHFDDVRNGDTSGAWTPVPANQTDTSPTGYVVATRCCSGNFVSIFKLTKNSGGAGVLALSGTMTVSSYSDPANAPQKGTNKRLDTIDTRLTQAVSAVDPSRGSNGSVAIWTQHTVFGGAGAQVRWYEINPATSTPFQSGTETSSSLFYYNAAIAPDRRANGSSRQFGANMAMAYNRSSSNQFIDIVAVSRVGSGSTTGPTVIKTSSAAIDDFSCNSQNVCRWGDYAGATPDPASATDQNAGQVWFTNGWSAASSGTDADWRTWNFAARPASK